MTMTWPTSAKPSAFSQSARFARRRHSPAWRLALASNNGDFTLLRVTLLRRAAEPQRERLVSLRHRPAVREAANVAFFSVPEITTIDGGRIRYRGSRLFVHDLRWWRRTSRCTRAFRAVISGQYFTVMGFGSARPSHDAQDDGPR